MPHFDVEEEQASSESIESVSRFCGNGLYTFQGRHKFTFLYNERKIFICLRSTPLLTS